MIGLLVAAGYLAVLVFLLSRKFVVDGDVLVVCFGVCGVAAGIGLIFVYRLLPRRNPIVLFADSGVVPIQHQPRTEIPVQAKERAPAPIDPDRRVRGTAGIPPVMKSHGSESTATYTTHDGIGVAAFVTVIGMSFIFAGRFDFGWLFLALALFAGRAMALGMVWLSNRRQNSGIVSYTMPVAGGIICLLCMIGLDLVMMRFGFLRYFLGLAILAGGAIAMGLNWSRRRRESASSSFV